MDDLFTAPAATPAEVLTVSFESWEGPLDLLLALARTQKVDLREISILALVEQYLAYVDGARQLKLELAADYLVMAAWLAYLKSAMLLPKEAQPEPSPEEMALRLQLRLQRLHAMREAGARLMAGDRIGRDVFVRPRPEGLHMVRRAKWSASLYDLIQAYGQIRARNQPVVHMVAVRPVMTLDEAIQRQLRGDAGTGQAGASGHKAGWNIRADLSAGGAVGRSMGAVAVIREMDDFARAVEAALFASEEPLTPAELRAHVGDGGDLPATLAGLAQDYAGRGVNLVERGGRWHFQTAADLAHILRRERDETRKLSRAAMETLAIIAYHEPVSRAEIEAIRGVQVAKGTLDVLMEAGWVRPVGRREVPGRPLIYATSVEFLSHFGLSSRRDLPGLDDLRAAGLLDPVDLALEGLGGQSVLEKDEEEA
ncbi:hypothetical protein LTR94_016303 [Friedmanniomyces endolithicus]|nr:hypothetical protein LTR94_016303 [Friedmanniomyces endolithicus]